MNLDVFYDVPITKIDKTRPYYSPSNNRIYMRGMNRACRYYTEVVSSGEIVFIISSVKVHSQSRRIRTDAFGRNIIIPIYFKDYLRRVYDKDTNIDIDVEQIDNDCIGLKLRI